MKPVVLPELRLRRFWFSVGVAIAVAVAVLCLAPGRSIPDVNISDKIKHLAAFAMLAFWFGSILVRRDLLWLAVALLTFGALIEVAQEMMRLGRSGEIRDLIADALGIVLGLGVALTPLGHWARWFESLLLTRQRR